MDGPLPFGGMLTCRQAFAAIPFCSAPKRTRLPTMSTIEFVDPELRDALALRPRSIARWYRSKPLQLRRGSHKVADETCYRSRVLEVRRMTGARDHMDPRPGKALRELVRVY
jgi:hypothetical protein